MPDFSSLVPLTLAQTPEPTEGTEVLAPTSGKSYALDAMLVVVLVGLALFAVCRTGPRR